MVTSRRDLRALAAREADLDGEVHQWKPCLAEAINGKRSHSALDGVYSPSIFFLLRRILDLCMGSNVGFTPSGIVPGGVADAHASRSMARCGEDDGLDCVSFSLLEGICAKCKGLRVIFVSFRVLFVSIISPLNSCELLGSSVPYPVQ